jgi:Tfp pilus assembly protein PilN
MFLRRKRKKFLQQLVIFLVVILVLGYFFILRPIKNVQSKGNMVLASAKEVKAALAENNIDLLKARVDSFSAQYQDFEKAAKKIYWLSFIPYFADFKNGVEAGDYLTTAVKETIVAISPYADFNWF